jgi:hypothetical protein
VESTTALGDWYGNLVRVGQRQFVLCTSDRSLLSVVFPAREVKRQMRPLLSHGLGLLLSDIGVPIEDAAAELEQMRECRLGTTASRSVLASMNDFMIGIDGALRIDPGVSMQHLNVELSTTLCGPLGYGRPAQRARDLLEGQRRRPTTRCSGRGGASE